MEFKRSLTPVLARGFHEGCKEIEPERKIVVYPGTESFPLGNDVEAMSLATAMTSVRGEGAR